MTTDGVLFLGAVYNGAMRWALLKRICEHLKRRRDSFDACPREQWDENRPDGWTSEAPCWKQRVYSHAHQDEVTLPRSEWCQSCLDRQTYHDALMLVLPMRAGAMRGMYRRCRSDWARVS